MTAALTDQQIAIVKSTIPVLETAGTYITEHFYQRLFKHNPELQHIFNMSNQDSGKQSFALFTAIATYAKYIDNLPVLKNAVERIVNKHTSLNIQAEHYPIVGQHLLATLQELAPDDFTEEVTNAWAAAYQQLADLLISLESTLYEEKSNTDGGWKNGRQFRLIQKNIESKWVKSLIFEPIDNKPVMDYLAGQYISIEVTLPKHEYREIRQYSLSDSPNGENYRISVKRETAGGLGLVSNYLHDDLRLGEEVTLYPPAGDFHYKANSTSAVLISAGVGITPMQSMLETLSKRQSQINNDQQTPDLHFLHACNTKDEHSFRKRLEQLIQQLPIQHHIWYSDEISQDKNTYHGLMNLGQVQHLLPLSNGDFYLCGPVSFMQFIKRQLITLGVKIENIHYEIFGPHESL